MPEKKRKPRKTKPSAAARKREMTGTQGNSIRYEIQCLKNRVKLLETHVFKPMRGCA